MALAGLVIVATLPLGAGWRVVGVVVWVLGTAHQMHGVIGGFAHCRKLHVEAGGALRIVRPDRSSVTAILRPGCVVFPRLAWLRFTAADGRRHVELLCPKTPQDLRWRRFQVIWRHLGAGL